MTVWMDMIYSVIWSNNNVSIWMTADRQTDHIRNIFKEEMSWFKWCSAWCLSLTLSIYHGLKPSPRVCPNLHHNSASRQLKYFIEYYQTDKCSNRQHQCGNELCKPCIKRLKVRRTKSKPFLVDEWFSLCTCISFFSPLYFSVSNNGL